MALSQSLSVATQAFNYLGAYTTVAILIVVILYVLRQLALPKPLPGIPYDHESAKSILGDLPGFAGSPNNREWAMNHGIKLKSPIFQVFVKPFQKPFVFVTDFYEMVDISMRRLKEFDRSEVAISMFEGIVPEQLITLQSHDPRFKRNKELVRDLMSPTFLHKVSAPHIYDAVLRLTDLWEKKAAFCNGKVFDAGGDIHHAALDMIVIMSFGLDLKRTHLVKKLNHLQPKDTPSNNNKTKNSRLEFEDVPLNPELSALAYLSDSTHNALRSPFPKLFHFYNRHFSSDMKKAQGLADQMRHREIAASIQRRDKGQAEWCALDHMIARESAIAEKEGRKPNFYSQAMTSEVLGYLIGGHETTSSTVRWSMKYLTDDQRAQSILRDALKAAYPAAASENRPPHLSDILTTHIPYLDAVIEENLRCSKVLPLTTRDAMVDTQVLGVPIPKGTTIALIGNGPGLTIPSTKIPFDETKYSRSATAKGYMQKYGRFDDVGIETYYPERWLKTTTDEKGVETVEFDANAGPIFAFGLGPRGCFGRKLAYLEMRIFFTLVFWKYKFGELPSEFAAHDEVVNLTRTPVNVFVRLEKA